MRNYPFLQLYAISPLERTVTRDITGMASRQSTRGPCFVPRSSATSSSGPGSILELQSRASAPHLGLNKAVVYDEGGDTVSRLLWTVHRKGQPLVAQVGVA
ncbi:hypothetical protein V8C26DRAFT_5865 [Trichoderma gracile]